MIWWTLLQHCCELVYNSMQVGAKFGANLEIRGKFGDLWENHGRKIGAKRAQIGAKKRKRAQIKKV